VVGSCEHGNEPSGSIKCGEFLDYLSVLLASQEGLCSMELVSFAIIKLSTNGKTPQGPTVVGTGSGTPEVPELPSAQGYSWATLSPGVTNTETWSSRLGVGLTTPHHKKTAVTESQERRPRPDMGCRAIGWIIVMGKNT
jgi:hypothetical protein